MTTSEKLKRSDELQYKLGETLYDLGIYRRVTTKAGYEKRKKLIKQLKELLIEAEDLNEELKNVFREEVIESK